MTARQRSRTPSRPSRVERLMESPRGRAEMAAADLASHVATLLLEEFAKTEISAKEVAETLGLTEGRVSQIRNGDGNVRISTLAKVLSALGRRVDISVRPRRASAPREGELDRTEWRQAFVSDHGVVTHEFSVHAPKGWELHPASVPTRGHGWTMTAAPTHQVSDGPWEAVVDEYIRSFVEVGGRHD